MRALFTAATGMQAQQVKIDTVANNLANVNSNGFKRSRAEFQDLFYETLRAPGARSADGVALPVGVQVGHGVKLGSVGRVHSQGERTNTGRELDLAIDGEGFFQLERADGETVYTRDGSFRLDRNGQIVSPRGEVLVPGVVVPEDAVQVTILEDGTVSATRPQQTQPTELGQIELARFANPAGLRSVGNNTLVPTEASGNPTLGAPDDQGFGAVTQGFLESSNVNMAEELVQMILAQRAFEVNSRVIQTGDDMMQAAAQISQF